MLWAPSVSRSLSTLIGYLERKCLLSLVPKDLCSPVTQKNFLQTMLYQHTTPWEVHILLSPLLWVANAISAIGFLDFSMWIHESILCSSEWDLNKWQRDLVTLRQWGNGIWASTMVGNATGSQRLSVFVLDCDHWDRIALIMDYSVLDCKVSTSFIVREWDSSIEMKALNWK